jgi:hypothetical protein
MSDPRSTGPSPATGSKSGDWAAFFTTGGVLLNSAKKLYNKPVRGSAGGLLLASGAFYAATQSPVIQAYFGGHAQSFANAYNGTSSELAGHPFLLPSQ